MSCSFSISIDRPRKLIRIGMGGFFDIADVEALRNDLLAKIATLGLAPNEHLSLCDVSQMAIQAQDVVVAFARLVGTPELQARRLAFVVGSTLARMQTRRLTDRANVRLFTDAGDAESWLMEGRPSDGRAAVGSHKAAQSRF